MTAWQQAQVLAFDQTMLHDEAQAKNDEIDALLAPWKKH